MPHAIFVVYLSLNLTGCPVFHLTAPNGWSPDSVHYKPQRDGVCRGETTAALIPWPPRSGMHRGVQNVLGPKHWDQNGWWIQPISMLFAPLPSLQLHPQL